MYVYIYFISKNFCIYLAPGIWWLGDYFFFLGRPIFRGYVRFREGIYICIYIYIQYIYICVYNMYIYIIYFLDLHSQHSRSNSLFFLLPISLPASFDQLESPGKHHQDVICTTDPTCCVKTLGPRRLLKEPTKERCRKCNRLFETAPKNLRLTLPNPA